MPGSSLELSSALEQRILAAASVLRVTPDVFLARVLSQYYNTIGGLPRDLLRSILIYLDYTTISAVLVRVCRLWHDCVLEDPQHFFSRLRQVHGIHLLDPAHGLFYFPRALKRVVMESKAGGVAGSPPQASLSGSPPIPAGSAAARRGHIPVVNSRTNAISTPAQPPTGDPSAAQVVPASSFLTVDIRTQNTKSLPWGYVRETVQSAIAGERVLYGEVRTPALQRTEDPVWSQAATVAFDRRLYMFGGETYEGVVLDRAYEYDPMTKHWGVLPSLNEKRAAAAAVAYGGLIFVFGGYNDEGNVLETYEVLEVESRTWISQTHPPQWLYGQEFGAAAEASPTGTRGSCRRASSVRASQDATASWPFTTVLPPSWTGVGRRSAVAGLYRMPEKVCGTAAAVHGDVILLVGGHKSCIEPEQTAVSYSAMNSAAATPMHATAMTNGAGTAAASDVASSTARTSPANTPQRLPRVGSISVVGPATAESFVWVFCPRRGRWWTQGPRLPSPRAFGAAAVLELPILGPCLCYFGGCAKADAPETAMFYIPLSAAAETRDVAAAEDGDVKAAACAAARPGTSPGAPHGPGPAFLFSAADAAQSTTTTPTTRTPPRQQPQQQQPRRAPASDAVSRELRSNLLDAEHCAETRECARGGESDAVNAGGGAAAAAAAGVASAVLARVFRDPAELPWQRYVRIPIGGAFTSVVVIGAAHSRTLVLTGFYPAPNIGFCKVNHLLPLDAFMPLLGALSPPLTARPDPATGGVSPLAADSAPAAHASSSTPPPPPATAATPAASAFALPPTLQLDPNLRDEAAVAVQHWHQEREWSQHQWREIRDMVRAAAHAATMRHPRNPQTAGEEHKWSLAPVPEVRVVNRSGPPLLRVSWKVQTLNAKVIVGIE